MKRRTIHEVAFRLTFDIKGIFSHRISELKIDLVPMQLRALRVIWTLEGATSQDIANTLKRDKAQIARLVSDLENRGLLSREPNPKDKRSKILKLTDAGAAIFKQIEDIEKDFAEDMVKDISDADLQTFFKVSDQLSENMKNMG